MNLKLERPLVVIDLESTGLNPRYDRIVEVGALKVMPDGSRETYVQRVNPERPIPSAASAVHRITDEDVADAPAFRDIASQLFSFIRNCDLGGFNILGYDLPMLVAEFNRAGLQLDERQIKVIDAKVIFHKHEPRTLEAALNFYCQREHEDAHAALSDVLATYDVIEAQLGRYDDLPHDVKNLDEYCNPADESAVDRNGRLRWILNKDFPEDVKSIVRDAMRGRFPTPPENDGRID